jgi:DNA-binding transcriptional LysR family regulator
VSLHIGQLRRELGDQLFHRTAAGLAFTPGGLRLASRSAELLGLQDRTILEVSEAGRGRRMLRVAASSLFAEHAAPGLLERFGARAADLDVELSVCSPDRFGTLLLTRAADIVIGPEPAGLDAAVVSRPVMNYQIILVVGPEHPLAAAPAGAQRLREQTWLLGPSAIDSLGAVPALLRRLAVPEDRQQIFQSHAAALEEAKRSRGVAPVLSFVAAPDLASGQLVRVTGNHVHIDGVWHTLRLDSSAPAAAELSRFAATPRAIQAMVRGTGVTVGRFRPSVHVTLWS